MGVRGRRRLSLQTLDVLNVMLRDPTAEYWGFQLTEEARLPPGSIYAILASLERAGWLTSRVEPGTHTELGRRPRHYFTLTGLGATEAREALEAASTRWSVQPVLPVLPGRAQGPLGAGGPAGISVDGVWA